MGFFFFFFWGGGGGEGGELGMGMRMEGSSSHLPMGPYSEQIAENYLALDMT